MEKTPYIGVTGFMSQDELIKFKEYTHFPLSKAKRVLMVGVLASLNTINAVANKKSNRYPLRDDIEKIFRNGSGTINLIHYNTKEPATLLKQLEVMTDMGGPNLNGFQLNIAWPNPTILEKYKKANPDKIIVLQIGGHAFEVIQNSPEKLALKIQTEYKGVIDYILLDPSGGHGKPFDSVAAHRYLSHLEALNIRDDLDIGLGVAGGLSSTTLKILSPLIKDFPDLSIDAEGRLRIPEDHLSVEATKNYILKSAEIISTIN